MGHVNHEAAQRVVVAVSPRMLGDTLTLALREHDLVVEVVHGADGPHPAVGREPADLAVVTCPELATVLPAKTVVIIPADSDDPTGRVLRPPHPEQRRDLGDLDSIIDLVAGLLGDAC